MLNELKSVAYIYKSRISGFRLATPPWGVRFLSSMEAEIWKDIPWFEDRYQSSNMWKVRSKPWIIKKKWLMFYEWKVLQPGFSQGWYMLCVLSIAWKCKTYSVHRLIAKTFIQNPQNKPQVNHINCIRHDNRVENLEWCTHSENQRYKFFMGRWPKPESYRHRQKHIQQLDIDWNFVKEWVWIGEVSRILGINRWNIQMCLRWIKNSAGWFKWKLKDKLNNQP